MPTDPAEARAAAERVLKEMDPEADYAYAGQSLFSFEADTEILAWFALEATSPNDAAGTAQWCLRNAERIGATGYALSDEYGRLAATVTDPETAIRIVRAMRGICTRADRAEQDLAEAASREAALRHALEFACADLIGCEEVFERAGRMGAVTSLRTTLAKINTALAPERGGT